RPMIQSIDTYLSQLKKELSGCDRATIQDALSDAEEYLRTALGNYMANDTTVSETDALNQLIEKYGTPEEIASAYREIEHRITPVMIQPSHPGEPEKEQKVKDERPFVNRFFGVFIDPLAWGSFLYLLFSLATGILYFTWVVTGISLSASLIILIIGLPFTGLFILSVRGIGLVEGRIVEALLGIRMPRRQQFNRRNAGLWTRFKNIILDKRTWFSIVYMILQLPLGTIYFSVFVTLIAVSLSAIAMPIMQLVYVSPLYINDTYYFLNGWMLFLAVIAGILLATLTMHLAKYVGHMHGMMAKTLLVRS
ncbi:sensor domain-containing protein, partial [Chloroflexota bacterium]